MICVDTSFLCSLYGNDAHTEKAIQYLKRLKRGISITILNEYEWLNSIRLAEHRGLRKPEESLRFQSAYDTDKTRGHLIWRGCDMGAVFEEAKRISSIYTSKKGYRSFDILHVAAAKTLRAKVFLTFDAPQRKLAMAEGFNDGMSS